MKLTSAFTKKLEEAGYELRERISAFSKEAVVYRAKQIHSLSSSSSSSSSQYVALKVYDLSRKKAADSFQRECQVLSALHHHYDSINTSHLQSYSQFTISLSSSSSSSSSSSPISASSLLRRVRKGSNKLFGVITMELLQFDGVDALSKLGPGHLSESLCLSIFLEVCLQLQALYSLGFAHCDIKPDNILLNVAPPSSSSSSSSSPQLVSIKVCDFGSSRPHDEILQSLVGTDLYFPPEVRAFSLLKKHSTPRFPMIAEKCDIWCLGVTLFCFFTGMLPYLYEDGAYMFNEIAMLEIPCLPRSLITSMLSFDPEDRPTLEQILQHDWLKERRD